MVMDEWNKKYVITLEEDMNKFSLAGYPGSKEKIIEGSTWKMFVHMSTNDRKEKILVVSVRRTRKKCDEDLTFGPLPELRITAKEGKNHRNYRMEPVRQGFSGASFHCDSGCKASIPWADINNQDLGLMDTRARVRFEVQVNAAHCPALLTERYQELIDAQPLQDLSLDFSRSLESGEFSDFTINLDNGESMKLHKNVLAARSSVFKNMINAGMKETQDNNVKFEHVDHCIMKKFIRYLYTSKVDFDEHRTTMELFKLAEIYDVARLKLLCELELLMRLTPETAADTLILADTYNAPDFRNIVLERVTLSKSCLYTPALVDALIQRRDLLTDLLKLFGDSLTKD